MDSHPLLGDSQGRYKVHITGNSGVGKSTLGKKLAALLDVPYISLDVLFWQPNWKETPTDEYRAKIRHALNQSDRGWVVDGNATPRAGDLISRGATDVIWLDPPLVLYFPRIFVRTLLRMLFGVGLCSLGCQESFSNVFFSKESILWWCLTNHCKSRARGQAEMGEIGIGVRGVPPHLPKMRRIGGWGRELGIWIKEVEHMVRSK